VQWFKDIDGKIAIFADDMVILQSIGATVMQTQENLRAQEAATKKLLGSELEASIRASFSTILPSILVDNKKETTGGADECISGYIKDYSI
jgi:hypothetical protein